MKRIPASVFILTFNSAKTIGRALESVRQFDDVIVCDGGSNDETLSIARAYGARIVPQDSSCHTGGRLTDFACARNGALLHTKYPWVLFIDSDETASDGLIAEISKIIETLPSPAAYRIPAGIILDGAKVEHSSNYPGYQIRFFHKDTGSFRKPIHERFAVHDGFPIRTLSGPWYYYVERATIREEFFKDLARDMPLYSARYHSASLLGRLRGMGKALKSIAGIFVRGIYNCLLYRGEQTYPLSLEWLRVRYQLSIIKTLYEM